MTVELDEARDFRERASRPDGCDPLTGLLSSISALTCVEGRMRSEFLQTAEDFRERALRPDNEGALAAMLILMAEALERRAARGVDAPADVEGVPLPDNDNIAG